MPIALIGTVGVVTLLYVLLAISAVGLVDINTLAASAAPVAEAFSMIPVIGTQAGNIAAILAVVVVTGSLSSLIMSHFIEGVLTEICTPFTADGTIDVSYLRDMINWQIGCGIRAFFVNGYAGECHELTLDEKLEVLRVVYEEARGRAKIMACSFENDVRANERLIDAYEKTGMADCYCITAPPFFKFSQAALYDWSAELIDYAKRPVYLYNCVEQAVLFAPDTLARLAAEHANLRGFKDASTNVINFQQCALRIDPESFDFLGGCDGFDGIMSASLPARFCIASISIRYSA